MDGPLGQNARAARGILEIRCCPSLECLVMSESSQNRRREQFSILCSLSIKQFPINVMLLLEQGDQLTIWPREKESAG